MTGQTRKADVLVVGHAVKDRIIDFQRQMSPRESLGGPVSYSSIALKSLGFTPHIITKVGDDFPATYSTILLQNGGIDLRPFMANGQKSTSFKIDRSSDVRKLWLLAKCSEISELDFLKYVKTVPGINQARSVVINTVAGELSLSLLSDFVKHFDHSFVDAQGFARAFAEDGQVSMKNGIDISQLSGIEFLKADSEELRSLTGTKELEASISMISKFVKYLILTDDSSTALIYEGRNWKMRTKPPSVKITDTTGAGDIFLAIFAAKYSESEDLEQAFALGTCSATMSVEGTGIEKAILDLDKVKSSLRNVSVEVN